MKINATKSLLFRTLLTISIPLLLILNCGVIHYIQPSEIHLQNMTRVPYDSMHIERNVSLGKWTTAFMYGKSWVSHDGLQTLKLKKTSDYKFGPMFIFSFPSFNLKYSDGVTLWVSLPTDTSTYDGNNIYHKMILSFGNSTKRVLTERIMEILITPEFLPVIQHITKEDDSSRHVRLSYRATGKTDSSGSADLTEEHDSLHFGCWDKFFEFRIIKAKNPNTPDMLSMSDVRIVQSYPGVLSYTTSTDIPCNLFYKVLIFLPPEIEKFSENIVLSCNLSDDAFKSSREFTFPIVAAKKHNALQKDTLVCRLDRDIANKICAQIKY